MKKYILVTLLLLVTAACGSKDNESYDMPEIVVSCSALDLYECGSAPSDTTVIVGLTKSSNNCLHTLTLQNRNWVKEDFDYSSEVQVSDQGNALVAVTDNWLTYAMTEATRIEPGSYTVCAFIDMNGNGYLNYNEPYTEDEYSPTNSRHTLKNWDIY